MPAGHQPHGQPQPPDWFDRAITDAVMALYVLRLDGTPAAAAIDACCEIWVRALWQQRAHAWQPEDADRIVRAALDLAATARRWPAPADLLDRYRAHRPDQLALPAPPPTPEQRAHTAATIRRLKALLHGAPAAGTFRRAANAKTGAPAPEVPQKTKL
jgi:hypothetical protein